MSDFRRVSGDQTPSPGADKLNELLDGIAELRGEMDALVQRIDKAEEVFRFNRRGDGRRVKPEAKERPSRRN